MNKTMYSNFNVKISKLLPVGRRSTSWAEMAQLRVIVEVLGDDLSLDHQVQLQMYDPYKPQQSESAFRLVL